MLKQLKPKKLFLLTTLWLLLALSVFVSFAGLFGHSDRFKVEAATSSTINFQARLLTSTGALVPDGYYNVEFKLYSVSSGGTAQWTETYYDSNGVTAGNDNRVRVVNGYLSVYLGSLTSFPSINWDQQEWVSLNIGGTTQTATPTWDGEMSPRLQLTAVPYAFRAGQLAKLTGANTSTLDFATQTGARSILLPDESGTLCIQGSTSCGFATGTSASYIQNGTSTQTNANFNIQSAASGSIVGVLKGASGQSADFLQIQNSGGNKLAGFDSSGKLQFADGAGGAYDTNLYRDSLDVLRTDDTFRSARLVAGSGTVGSSGVVTIRDNVGGTTHSLWISRNMNNSGAVIRIGGDTTQSLTAPILSTEISGEADERFLIQWGGTLQWGDGTTLDTSLSRSAAGQLTTNGDLVIQGGDLITNQTTFNLLAAATTAINIGPASNTAVSINLAGGGSDTGCTITGNNGNLTCSGAIATNATTGTQGWWTRSSSILSPVNAGDAITTSGNISTSGSGAITSAGTFTANGQSVVIQPSSSLTSGQTNISQTLTNASSSGGTVTGYNQAFTVSNTSSASTTNGISLSLTDSASSLTNQNTGISISVSGSNGSRGELGLDASVAKGIALRGLSSGSQSNSLQCNGVSIGLGLCAGDTATSNSGAGIYAYTSSRNTGNIYDPQGTAVYGINQNSGGTNGAFLTGVKGISNVSGSATYTSMGVYGRARGGASATIYGGYFTLDPASTSTSGAALYASNSTVSTNILQLQDNTTDVFTVANGGDITATGTYNGQTISSAANFTGTATIAGLLTANGNLTLQAGDTFTMNGDALTDLTGAGLTVSSGALTVDNNVLDDNFFMNGGNSFGGTATLGTNDSNSLAFETGGTTKWFINTSGHLLPNIDDTYDIGSDTARVRDLYAGPGTIHVGTSTSDEGTLSYNTTTNNLTVASTNGVLFQNSSNSSTAFQIQASGVSGNQLFTADTSNNRINVIGDVNAGNRYGNRLFSDNFESGGFRLWSESTFGSISIDTGTVHDGKYSAKLDPAGTIAYTQSSITPNNTVYFRGWFNVTSQSGGNSANLMSLNAGSTGCWAVYRDSSGVIHLYNCTTSSDAGTGGSMALSGWHSLEMRVTIGSGTGTSQVWLDGTQIINATSQSNGTAQIDKVQIGDTLTSNTATFYADDLSADTASNGTASSLNVDDSLHVGGTASFGNSVLIQNTLTVGSLQPVTPGAPGTTSLATIDSTGTVGQHATVKIGLDGYPRISYYDTTNTDLKFAQCTNAACTSSNVTTIDSTGTVGQFNFLAIGSDGFARISYYDTTNTDLKFVQCTNASCSSKNTNVVDSTGTVGQYSSVVMGADGFARISYYDGTNGDLKYAQCTNAACSASNITTVDSTGTVGQYSAIDVGSDGFARIAYRDNTNGLKMVRCTNATCTTNVITIIDSSTTATWNSIVMGADGFARISYNGSANNDLKFVQCTNANCTSNNITFVDSADSVGTYTGVVMGADGFARISYYNATDGDLMLAQCMNASCSNNNITTVDSVGTVGTYSSVAVGSDGYFSIAYYDTTNTDLKLARVGNAFTGSSIGSSNAPFGSIYGTTLNVQGTATFQQSVQIDNNLTVNGAIYVNGNTDSSSYSVNGTAGLTLTCSSGSSLENAIISGGIITGGDCIASSYATAYNSANQNINNGTVTVLALNSESNDTDSYHSNVTNNSRMTVSSSGWYNITGQVCFNVNATGTRLAQLKVNGTTEIARSSLATSAADWSCIQASAQVFLNTTDYVELQAYQTSGGVLAVFGGAAVPGAFLSISKVQSGGSGVNNSLQQGYDMGNTITTTTGRDILFNLADTATDSNFIVDALSGSTGKFAVQNAGADVFSVIPDSKTVLIANNLAVYGGGTGVNGGAGLGANGDQDGGGGGGIGGGAPTNGAGDCPGDTGGQANDISGLLDVVSGVSGILYPKTGPGAGFGVCPNINGSGLNHGNPATGFGSGGGGPNYYGGNGGNGKYGGGGAGAAGESGSGNTTGGNGGQGVVVFSPEGSTDVVQTSGTSWAVPGGVTRVKVWAIGAGGGGAGSISVNSSSGGGGGAGGVTYKVFDVTPGQTISYSLGAAGTGATGGVNGNAGGTTTVTVGPVTLTATGGAGGVYNNASSNAGGSFSGGDTVSITGNLSATGNLNLFKNTSNSTSAFQVQNAAGSTIFNIDTQNNRVNVASALQTGGTTRIDASGNLTNIGNITGTGAINVLTSGFNIQTAGGVNMWQFGTTHPATLLCGQTGNNDCNITSGSSLTLNGGNTAKLQVGSSTTDANIFYLVVDSYNNAVDPSGPTNGGMYYNTATNTFRCYENTLWKNCIDTPSNASTADQSIGASTTAYLTNSNINIPRSGVRAGSTFTWRVTMSKTGAGTAVNTFDVRFGTNGTTADTSRCSFSQGTQTGVIDTAVVDITVTVRSVSASGVIACNYRMTHNLATTGFDNTLQTKTTNVTSGTFDNTVANSVIGLSYTTGALYNITVQQVQVTTTNL